MGVVLQVVSQAQTHLYGETAQGCAGFTHLFRWFEENISNKIGDITNSFWTCDYGLKLICLEKIPGVFWEGSSFFVSQAEVSQDVSCFLRISDSACKMFFETSLGSKEDDFEKFRLNGISELESKILTKYNNMIFEKLAENFISKEKITKLGYGEFSKEKNVHIGLFLYSKKDEELSGKIIFSLPMKLLDIPEIIPNIQRDFDYSRFNSAKTELNVSVGRSKITLEEVKQLEQDDIVILENSNINKMKVMGKNGFGFKINPNPRLVVNIDQDEGDNEMSDQTNPQDNMWDNIQIDVGAEFDKVKLTLGELRQMEEGLVVDLASIYDNKITLTVENKAIASGELVIIDDKYGVRITQMVKEQEQLTSTQEEIESPEISDEDGIDESPDAINRDSVEDDDDDFDLSDFEIDDDI